MRKRRRYASVSQAAMCATKTAAPRALRRLAKPSRSVVVYLASWMTNCFDPKQHICPELAHNIQTWMLLQVMVILLRAQPGPLALDIADIQQQIGRLRLQGDRVEIGRSQI